MNHVYNREILRLAASTASASRLIAPQGSALKVSQLCGSKVTADVDLDQAGRICRFGLEIRACALGQAAAALVAARDELADWLTARREAEPGWPGMGVFAPARPHRARHPSILLTFDATIAAIADARGVAAD